MKPTKEEVTREHAEWHFEVEEELKEVLRFISENEDAPDEPLKILEVNAATVWTGTIELLAFAPKKSRPYVLKIAEVTPEEFEQIERGEIKLPQGWSLETAQRIRRPDAA